jgi:predicted alpha/beta-fold hydrolase
MRPEPPRPDDFRPLPLLGNAHVQTVLGTLLTGPDLPPASRERLVPLADGDRLVAHDNVPPAWRPGDPVALLVHGMGGTHRSGHMLRLASLLLARGWRVVRLDLRGSGQGEALARRIYNAASSDDLRAAAAAARSWAPTSPLYLVGFSLGGNIVLKLAGEAAADPVPDLAAVAAVNPPIDLMGCSELLALPRNRLYELHFLQTLLRLVRRLERHFPDRPRSRFPRRMSVRLFDELYTAPRGGFADAADYYRRGASLSLIPHIRVPTLILTARDDPFITVAPFEGLQPPPHVQVRIVDHGGHLGYLGWDGGGIVRWAERRVADWLTARAGG